MKKIAHEAPIAIFEEVQKLTDYDYALVHLFEESEQYHDQFIQALKKGREVILDNSIFELGEAFDMKKFAEYVYTLRPTYYIIPDVLEDCNGTISNFDRWHSEYGTFLNSKSIGVAQGRTYKDFIECYKYLVDKVDKIAISFDYSFYEEWTSYLKLPTKYHQWNVGRKMLLYKMISDDSIRTDKPHHLLGCSLPQEFNSYVDYTFIDSIDTSNPVVCGLKNIRYNGVHGLSDKPSQKLFTMINSTPNEKQIEDIKYNIEQFRMIVNGRKSYVDSLIFTDRE